MAIELRLTMFEDGHPDRTFAYRISAEEMADARAGPADLGPFQSPEIVALMHRRGQHKLIERATNMLGVQMGDFRDDRDGWNGDRRSEIISASYDHHGK